MIRQAADDGVDEFRFLSGNQPYKARLPNSDRPVERLAISHGLVGKLAIGALDLKLTGSELRHQLRTRIARRPPTCEQGKGKRLARGS
jgi:CelD/BcsL family acetyltransferase involved in cellulose biosynthesis